LEAVQDVDRFLELGHEHHPENALGITDTDLPGARADFIERLPVGGVKASLNLAELEARFLAGSLRERDEIVVGGTYPPDFFLIAVDAVMRIKFYTCLCGKSSSHLD
jgi:hypothetical protein